MSIWSDIGVAIGLWTLIAIPTACVFGFIFCKLDHHPKDGPRCRKCDFDLRASTGDSCTECGAPFKLRGVWPPDKPSRKRLAAVIAIWSWLVVSFAIGIQFLYNDYEFDFAQRGYVETECASLFGPKSNAYSEAFISDSGNGFRLLPDQFGFPDIEAKYASIWLETLEGEIIICAFELETGTLTKPEGPITDEFLSVVKHFSTSHEQREPVDYLLSTLKTESAPITDEEAVRAELAFLVELSKDISEGKIVATHWDDLEALIQTVLDRSDYQRYYAYTEVTGWSEHYYFPILPVWTVYVLPIISFAIWGMGVFALRFVVYRRQAADAVPASA